MSKPKTAASKALAFALSFLMATSTFTPQSLAYAQEQLTSGEEAIETQDVVLDTDDAAPAEDVAAAQDEAAAADVAAPAQEAAEESLPAFSDSVELKDDGVVVYAEAEEGTFPAGAKLDVQKVELTDAQEQAVDDATAEGQNVAKRYSFDVRVLDAEGNELEPADGHKVNVRFALAEAGNQNLEAAVYHHDDEDEKVVEELEAADEQVDGEDVVAVETEGFSVYTIDFTYGILSYSLAGGDTTAVRLTAVLESLGLKKSDGTSYVNGDITSASAQSSNSAVYVDKFGENWTVGADDGATGSGTISVTLNDGVNYQINVVIDSLVAVPDPASATYTGEVISPKVYLRRERDGEPSRGCRIAHHLVVHRN